MNDFSQVVVNQINTFDDKRPGDFLEWHAKLLKGLSLYNRQIVQQLFDP